MTYQIVQVLPRRCDGVEVDHSRKATKFIFHVRIVTGLVSALYTLKGFEWAILSGFETEKKVRCIGRIGAYKKSMS